MATVKRETTSQGPRWRVRYRRPDGSETSKRFDRRHKADDFAVRVENDRRAGSYVDPAGPRTGFPEVVDKWKAVARHGPGTVPTRDSDLKKWILPGLGRYRIGQVGEPELTALVATCQAGLAPATVERVWAWVTAIFGYAVRARLLAVNPTRDLGPPSAPRQIVHPLEGDQVEAAIAALPAWYRSAAILGADAGLRQGEVFGLAVPRVGLRTLRDLVLPVERQLATVSNRKPFLKLPKGEKVRQVPMPASVAESIAAHLAEFPPRAIVPDSVSGGEQLLVFASSTGAPVTRSVIRDAWNSAARRADLPARTTFHDLRHYYASVLIDAGCSEREIGKRLGHSSVEVTLRYGDLLDRAADRTRDAVAASIAARKVSAASIPRPRGPVSASSYQEQAGQRG
jgi:integrase